MAEKAAKEKSYVVASDDGSWHYLPVEASSPEDAVRQAEPEAETAGHLSSEYYVYELVSKDPTIILTKVQLVRK